MKRAVVIISTRKKKSEQTHLVTGMARERKPYFSHEFAIIQSGTGFIHAFCLAVDVLKVFARYS